MGLGGLGGGCQDDIPSDYTDDEPGSDPEPAPEGESLLFDPPPPPMEAFEGEDDAVATVETLEDQGEFMNHFKYFPIRPKRSNLSNGLPMHFQVSTSTEECQGRPTSSNNKSPLRFVLFCIFLCWF